MLRSIGKQSGESVESVLKKKKGYGGKDLQKRKVSSRERKCGGDRILIHTHPFNGPFSGTTRVGRYQKGKTNLDFIEARDSEWQWHQLGHNASLHLAPDR